MGSSTVPSTHFSTESFEEWRETISVVFDVEQPSAVNTGFAATFEAFQLGDLVVTDARLGEQRYIRTARQARRDGIDHLVLNLYRTGGWKAQTDQGEFEGKTGQISLLDLSRDLISDEPESSLVTLFIPRGLLEDRLPDISSLHGRAPTGPYVALLVEFIDLLARRLPTLPGGDEKALGLATCEMVAACLQPSLAGVEAARPGLELVLRHRARRFIEAHLQAPALSTDAICNAIGASRRTLYRLFDQEGGVQRYIHGRRLERIHSALADPRETRRIADIAAEFGFARHDHFARAFKNQFGHSARDVREAMRRGHEGASEAQSDGLASAHGFGDWIRALTI